MGKLRQWFSKLVDKLVEKSFQRQADRMFLKSRRDND